MKPISKIRPAHYAQQRGFALVVTLSLMILLTIIAVGLLSLATISLRSASQNDAMAVARSNARMALMLAIGDLQKYAGPDQRVTARADVLGQNIANPRLTGVWKSWDINATSLPSPADYEKPARDQKFLGWLASSVDRVGSEKITFAGISTESPVTLLGEGTLGKNAFPGDIVTAAKVPTAAKSRGAFAWAVMDEGVKVRINTPYEDSAGTRGMQTAQLGSGERPNTSSIPGLEKLNRSLYLEGSGGIKTIDKGVTRQNFELAAETLAAGTRAKLKPLTHDVTSTAAGIFTDTAIGGLKEDFSLLANAASLPTNYSGKGVYDSRLGMTGPSDPRWESLQQFAGLYKDSTRLGSSASVPVLKAQGPSGWVAASGSDLVSGKPGIPQLASPPGVVLMPTVAKVQIVFSLLTRDIYNYPRPSGDAADNVPKTPGTNAEEILQKLHHPWDESFAGSSFDYLLHLLYTPVVTLHNPYNVALELNDLKVVFGNVPFALQVFRNGEAQTNGLAPLDTMFHQNAETGNENKRFGISLKNNGGSSSSPSVGSSTFKLLPGEVMMFSPFIDPNRTWYAERGPGSQSTFADWETGNQRTISINALPGWRGNGIGFDLDWFCPSYNGLRVSEYENENGRSMWRGGCIPARKDDTFSVKFAPLGVPDLSKNKFTVEMFIRRPGASATDLQISSGIIEMDYETPKGLQDTLLGPDGTLTSDTFTAMEMHSHSSTAIGQILSAKPFAMISAQAKATLGGSNVDDKDGRNATKPWCFGHAQVAASSSKFVTEHPANHPNEITLQRLDISGTDNVIQYELNTGRGNFITGHTNNTGLKFGVMNDIPLTPLQTLSSLNGANPGGSSGYLPRFAQPIGNSWAHPLLDSSKAIQPGSSATLLDHSFLLNLALYDHFYFSGLADQTGQYGTTKTAAALVSDFIAGKSLVDPRLKLNIPAGLTSATLAKEVTSAADNIHSRVAAWQLMHGAFNINSTSVAAWKAMLGSIHDSQAIFNSIEKVRKKSTFTNLSPTDTGNNETRISRLRLPVSQSAQDGAIANEAYWLGPREYSDAQLQILAENIVEQVRLRGPFLSMSEFVNRRLGTGDTAQRGALQQAIDNAELNQDLATEANAGFDIPASKVSNYQYKNVEAGTGPSYQGAPGYLSQADLLSVLGNAATPRSDTFTIRGYGEARDAANKPTATAMCEAVMQRVPDYIDPTDRVEVAPAALTSTANKNFGRRFQMISFRWLNSNEI